MIKKALLSLAKKNKAAAHAKRGYQRTRDAYYAGLPIDDKLVVFEAFRSTKYADSPKAIYEYMLSAPEYRDYKFIWAFEHPEKHPELQNSRTKLVKHETNGYYTAFARAKFWVVNGWIPLRIQKKPGQIALQCWHGTPLKRLRYDIPASADTTHREAAFRDNDIDMVRYDYFISPSRWASKTFISAFNLKKLGKADIMIETGYPRNDYLLTYPKSDIARLKKKFDLPTDKKVILYAPTWRDDQLVQGEGYEYQTPVNFEYLRDKLSDEYIILFRAHNLVANAFDFSKYEGFIYDVSNADDINELYVISDVLVTDYSSVFFDYANLRRPVLFFMYDKEHYEKDLRGFYLDLDTLPGGIVTTEAQLAEALGDLSSYQDHYKRRYQSFNRTYNYLDDGHASQRVAKKLTSGS